jgi:hypothetical protein
MCSLHWQGNGRPLSEAAARRKIDQRLFALALALPFALTLLLFLLLAAALAALLLLAALAAAILVVVCHFSFLCVVLPEEKMSAKTASRGRRSALID